MSKSEIPPVTTCIPPFSDFRREDSSFMLGEVRYDRIGGVLGEGMFGVVHRFHPQGNRPDIVCKIYKSKEMYHQEALNEARFNMKVYGFGSVSKKDDCVLAPFFPGITLNKIQFRSVEMLIIVWIQVLIAVKQMHEKGAVHWDLKDDNIIFNPEERKANVIDLGNAEDIGSRVLGYDIEYSTSLQHPPELCGLQLVQADPNQDCFYLGHCFEKMVSRQLVVSLSPSDSGKIANLTTSFKKVLPAQRLSIQGALCQLHADFVIYIPAPIPETTEAQRTAQQSTNDNRQSTIDNRQSTTITITTSLLSRGTSALFANNAAAAGSGDMQDKPAMANNSAQSKI